VVRQAGAAGEHEHRGEDQTEQPGQPGGPPFGMSARNRATAARTMRRPLPACLTHGQRTAIRCRRVPAIRKFPSVEDDYVQKARYCVGWQEEGTTSGPVLAAFSDK
jgi:hypothetical protein